MGQHAKTSYPILSCRTDTAFRTRAEAKWRCASCRRGGGWVWSRPETTPSISCMPSSSSELRQWNISISKFRKSCILQKLAPNKQESPYVFTCLWLPCQPTPSLSPRPTLSLPPCKPGSARNQRQPHSDWSVFHRWSWSV